MIVFDVNNQNVLLYGQANFAAAVNFPQPGEFYHLFPLQATDRNVQSDVVEFFLFLGVQTYSKAKATATDTGLSDFVIVMDPATGVVTKTCTVVTAPGCKSGNIW